MAATRCSLQTLEQQLIFCFPFLVVLGNWMRQIISEHWAHIYAASRNYSWRPYYYKINFYILYYLLYCVIVTDEKMCSFTFLQKYS